jgi:DNA-binding HxlR family transcriptional regulator
MQRTSFSEMSCPVAQALEVVGEWWTLLILRDVFRGRRRFDELQEGLGIARNILARRLSALVESGVLEKRA